ERFKPTDSDRRLRSLIEAGDEESLLAALEIEPDNETAIVALAEKYIAENRHEEALAILARIPETGDVRRVAALARTGEAESAGDAGADIDATLEDLLTRVRSDD